MAAGKRKTEENDPETLGNERTLRDDAEQQLARSPKRSADLKGQTPEELIHELEVHQVELETQAEELRRAHIALEESRNKYLDLYDFAPTSYLTLTEKALIAEVNLAGETLLGVERRKLVNARFRSFVGQKNLEQWDRYFLTLLDQGEKQICTLTLKRSNGSMFPARIEGIRTCGSGGVTTVRIAFSDISDIWEIEALRASEERFHSMFERHDSVMLLVAPDSGKIIEANLAASRFYGRSQKELRSISIDEINVMSPEEIAAARMKAARDQENFFTFFHRLASGEIRAVEVHSSPIDIGGKTVLFSIVNDITDRRRAEKALQLTLSRLESAMDAGNIAWWEMDCSTGNVLFSERKAQMLGYPAEQFSHYTDFTTLLHPDDSEPTMQAMRDHLSGLKKQYDVEYRIRTRDGGYRWFHDIGRIYEYTPDGKPNKVTGLVIDISERKRAEEAQVKTTRKLNVLSDLTRKDLTSQIFVLDGYLNLAKKHADDQDQVIKMLLKGEPALRSIHEIIEYTKDYQEMGIKPATWQNVNLALLLGLSHVSIGEIQHSLETENLEIFADPLLEKVCQRLFENSLAHGGHVTRIRVWHTKTPGGITILFEDDGIGIPQEKKEQIFLRGDDPTRLSMRSLIFVREILDITGARPTSWDNCWTDHQRTQYQ